MIHVESAPSTLSAADRERRRPRPAVAFLFAVAFIAATNATAWSVYLLAASAFDEEQSVRLVTFAKMVARVTEIPPTERSVVVMRRLSEIAGLDQAFVLDGGRRVVALVSVGGEDPALRADQFEIARAYRGEAVAAVPYPAQGRYFRRAYAPIRVDDVIVGVAGVAAPADAFERIERLKAYLWAVAGASLLAVAVLFAAYRRWGRYLRGLAAAMERNERLAAVGAMAATVAHEVRNPLGIIRATADVLERENPLPDSGRELVEDIRTEVARLDGVVTGLLDLTRTPVLHLDDVDVNVLVERVVNDWERGTRGQGPEHRCDLDPGAGTIRADGRRLRQALLNLVLNAAEAAGESGHVEVRTARTRGGVEISVADDGPGVPAEARPRLFEPFFTTKPRGAGLGLAVVAAVLRAHGGTAEVSSRPGRGAVFIVRLSAAPPDGSDTLPE